jgi:hypothetical protein
LSANHDFRFAICAARFAVPVARRQASIVTVVPETGSVTVSASETSVSAWAGVEFSWPGDFLP